MKKSEKNEFFFLNLYFPKCVLKIEGKENNYPTIEFDVFGEEHEKEAPIWIPKVVDVHEENKILSF